MSDDEEGHDDYEYEEAVSEVPSEDEAAEAGPGAAEDGSDDESDAESAFPEDEPAPIEVIRARADPVTAGANTAVRVIIRRGDLRTTDNRLHKSEASHIISVRAQEIARNETNYATSSALTHLTDPCDIAALELAEGRCPLLLRRLVGTAPTGELIYDEYDPNTMARDSLPFARQIAKKAQ